MKKCKKNLSVNKKIKGVLLSDFKGIVYLYNIVDRQNNIIYVGITSDLRATEIRHVNLRHDYFAEMIVLGSFYDRSIAEFMEISLIKELLSQGVKLRNKVVDFN